MIKDIQIWQKIKHFFDVFDKRSYEVFRTVVSSVFFLRNWKQADIANFWEKTLWQIQYFFAKSKWNFRLLNNLRLQRIRNKISGAWDKKSDILVLDSTIIAKSKKANFCWLTKYFFSNKDKKDLLKRGNYIFINSSKLWVLKKVKLKSWFKKWIDLEVNIIVFQKKGFKDPSVLCTSADVKDIYENMIREVWDLSWCEKIKKEVWEKSILKIEEENKVYYAFTLLYERRWSIEQCFKELKTYLWFENFQVQTYNSIMKYLHIVILVHTLMYITLSYIYQDSIAKILIYEYLKKKRNIKNKNEDIYFSWLKLFIEMITLKPDDFKQFCHLKLFNFSISLKFSCSLSNQNILT